MIQAGDAEVVVAGGMESMTNAPYLLPKARAGYRMGNGELLDSLIQDGLWCAFDAVHMGVGHRALLPGRSAASPVRPRTSSRPRATSARPPAIKEGRFADEIAPVRDPPAQGRPDRGRPRTKACAPAPPPSRSAGCKPAFEKDGTITAGNASQISDGAAAGDRDEPRARPTSSAPRRSPSSSSFGMVAGPDTSLLTQPSRAIKRRSSRSTARSPTSTCSSSTRRSPPSASRRCTTSASPTTSST